MSGISECHILGVGFDPVLVEGLFNRIAEKSSIRFSHLLHPMYVPDNWPDNLSTENISFFREKLDYEIPRPDRDLLASLECDDVPTIHNMILSDRILSKLSYEEALGYSTFLARRMIEEFTKLKPSIVIGAYDGMHGSLGLAVCRYLNIPWFCMHFSVIPTGLACFCSKLTPAARVNFGEGEVSDDELLSAEALLTGFEDRKIEAMAYIAPRPLSIFGKLQSVPRRIESFFSTAKRWRQKESIKYTEEKARYSIIAALCYFWNRSIARRALEAREMLLAPPEEPYVFFGLHMQPESTIDVWAHFYSNQIWVIETLSRSVPPSCKLLVKVHKSDIANYSRKQLEKIAKFPGVKIVDPVANTHQFIKRADLIVSIQGTIGLEAALFGKPVIMLGDSPNTIFNNVTRIDNIVDLPILIRSKLCAPEPDRGEIIASYAKFLQPFEQAGNNDWGNVKTDKEIDGFVTLFSKLEKYVNIQK